MPGRTAGRTTPRPGPRHGAAPGLPLALLACVGLYAVYLNIIFDLALAGLMLLTGLALGGLVPLRGLKAGDALLARLASGLGVLALLVWLSTFGSLRSQSLFLVLSAAVILWRREALSRHLGQAGRIFARFASGDRLCACLFLAVAFFWTLKASAPISAYDALTKHVAIPWDILNNTHYDYNVVRSIVYGDFALGAHMLYLYLLTLGGHSAMVYVQVAAGLTACLCLMRVTRQVAPGRFAQRLVVLLVGATPLVFMLSSILYVDMVVCLYAFPAVLLLVRGWRVAARAAAPCGFLFGCALFVKPSIVSLAVPALSALGFSLALAARRGLVRPGKTCLRAAAMLALFLLPALPSVLVIWHKTGNPFFPAMNNVFQSPYFPREAFPDPFGKSELGYGFTALWRMVFHTDRFIEMAPGGLGYHLLLLPAAFLPFFTRYRRKYALVCFLCAASFALALMQSRNARYLLPAFLLTIPLVAASLDTAFSRLRPPRLRQAVAVLAAAALTAPCAVYLAKAPGMAHFSPAYFHPRAAEWVDNPVMEVLSSVDDKKTWVLAFNEEFRGVFKGQLYSLTWHNSFVLELLERKVLTPETLLQSFDYLLYGKAPSLRGVASLHPSVIADRLEVFRESQNYVLYRIRKRPVTVLKESLAEPARVTVSDPRLLPFEAAPGAVYSLALRVEAAPDGAGEAIVRFQVNWHDEKGGFLGVSLLPAPVPREGGPVEMARDGLTAPEGAVRGLLYLTSHTDVPVVVHGYRLTMTTPGKGGPLVDALRAYGRKWPHLAPLSLP